ncbi:hypothetical protein [Paenibacillus sp. LHD-38]|uniref:alpha/beta hydrolase family protein n=1 Tax=Paenibacillus sp. LHD-38 TaxID=3072143 RepID=UPI00280DD9CB|nr:hypothetical protein [Paenibacillus sp. LHD-38]MDQ8739492.1 hypothetical protein [Paenibacillus sp. LHD-38]
MRIGRTTRVFTDIGRDNPFKNDGSKRRFMISIYYPSYDSDISEHEPVYPELFHPGEETAIEFLNNFGADVAYLNKLKTNVYYNAGILEGGVYPVIIYSPAFGIERDMYWFNIKNLVIQGFVVLTIGATYDSVFTVFPDGEYVQQLKTLADLEGTDFEGWLTLLEIRIQDIRYVLDKLPELNEIDELLKNKVNLQRIGLIGHSLGGAAVYRVLKENSLIKAGILLDPSLHLLGSSTSPLSTPVLLMRQNSTTYEMLINDGWNETVARETIKGQSHLASVLTGYKSFIKIHGANHVTFSDAPIHFNETAIDIKHDVINEVIASFLDEFVYDRAGEYTNKIGEISGISLIGSDESSLSSLRE